jgi:hypothetical protein
LLPLRRLVSKAALDIYVKETVKAIKEAIDKAVLRTHSSERAREGWTEECKAVLAEAKRLKRAHSQRNTDKL